MGYRKKGNKKSGFRTQGNWARKEIEKLIVAREEEAAVLEKQIELINEAYTDTNGDIIELTTPKYIEERISAKSNSDAEQQSTGLKFITIYQRELNAAFPLDVWIFEQSKPALTKEELYWAQLRLAALASERINELKKIKRQIKSFRRLIAKYFFVRDRRHFYRYIIRFLFKNLDDESEIEKVVRSPLTILSHVSTIHHGLQKRGYTNPRYCS